MNSGLLISFGNNKHVVEMYREMSNRCICHTVIQNVIMIHSCSKINNNINILNLVFVEKRD